MKTSIKFLHWTPRILTIVATLFISIFALDAFEGDQSVWQHILGFLIHLIPTYIMTAILIVAWKWELVGGIIFATIGLITSPMVFMVNYNRNHNFWMDLGIIGLITFPFILIGVLFILSHISKKKSRKIASAV